MFLKKFQVLFIIAIALSPTQCIYFPDCAKGEINYPKCWYVTNVSCESRVKTHKWSCTPDCVCKNDWHIRDADNKCIPVWKCPGICPPNSRFLHCTKDLKSSYVEFGLPLAEFKKICQPKCECEPEFERTSDGKACVRGLLDSIIHDSLMDVF